MGNYLHREQMEYCYCSLVRTPVAAFLFSPVHTYPHKIVDSKVLVPVAIVNVFEVVHQTVYLRVVLFVDLLLVAFVLAQLLVTMLFLGFRLELVVVVAVVLVAVVLVAVVLVVELLLIELDLLD